MSPSLTLISLLKQLTALRETLTRVYQFSKGCDKGYGWTFRGTRWVGKGMREEVWSFHVLFPIISQWLILRKTWFTFKNLFLPPVFVFQDPSMTQWYFMSKIWQLERKSYSETVFHSLWKYLKINLRFLFFFCILQNFVLEKPSSLIPSVVRIHNNHSNDNNDSYHLLIYFVHGTLYNLL